MAASFWTDPKVKKLTFEGKGLLLYFITNPHTHVSGIYVLPRPIIQHETLLPKSRLDTLCHTLSSLGFCAFDEEKDVIWVRKMMAYQGRGEKHLRSAAAHIVEDLHNSFLCKQFIDTYPDVKQFMRPSFIDTLPDTLSDGVSGFGPPDSRFPIPDSRILNPDTRDTEERLPPPPKRLGEFSSVVLTDEQQEKLRSKLNSHFDAYVNRLDRYSQTKPREFAKYKSHYAVLLTWFDRDVKEGNVHTASTPKTAAEMAVELRRRHGIQ